MFPTAYHFLPARKSAVVRRLLSRLPDLRTVAMLDLEDSAGDALAPERTHGLKVAARDNLETLFADGWQPPCTLGVRINAYRTPYYLGDVEVISRVLRRGRELAILLPKVESAADVSAVVGDFAAHGVPRPLLYLLIESDRGVRNLPDIVASARPVLAGLFLGMIDYSADQQLWPFPGPLSPVVWSLAKNVADAAAEAGILYVHTPCLRLRDVALVHAIRRRLRTLSRGPVGMLTLSLDQTRALLTEEGCDLPHVDQATHAADPAAEARDIVQQFCRHAGRKRSFSVDDANDRYIPPQEYLAALRFLREHGLSL